MPTPSAREIVRAAVAQRTAVPAFNIPYLPMMAPVVQALRDTNTFGLIAVARLELVKFEACSLEAVRAEYERIKDERFTRLHMDHVPVIGGLTHATEDFSAFFCSELVAAGLEAGGAIRSLNCSEVTPLDVVQFAIYEDTYYQLRGDKTLIEGYNTLNPESWGE